MRVGSLFSGIGGFEIGLRAALDDVDLRWLCDNAEFPRRVLSARFPGVPLYGRSSEIDSAADDVDLLVAGFPCQPVSQAGLKRAQDDSRWLWPEVERIIEAKRPLLVVVENVRGLLSRGLREILGDLSRLGYSAQWDTISAYAVGAPHIRQRVWIVASREPLGRVFGRKPRIVSGWIGNEPRPRLEKGAPHQTARLEALGNAVVPQVVTHVVVSAIAALASEPWEPPATISDHGLTVEELGSRLRPAGALIGDRVFGLHSSSPKIGRRRLWPSPAANEASWSLAALLACRDEAGRIPPADLLKRWYHPETAQIVQTGLEAVVRMVESGLWSEPDGRKGPWLRDLWSTPLARDSKGASFRTSDLTTQAQEDVELLLPTPVSSDSARGRRGAGSVARGGGESLREAAESRVWLTPHGFSGGRKDGGYDGHANELTMQVIGEETVLPTPTSSDRLGSRRSTARQDHWTSNPGTTLTDAVWESDRVLPTPRAVDSTSGPDYARAGREGSGGDDLQTTISRSEQSPKRLSPTWVEWMMGLPLGWTNPDQEVEA